MVNTFRILVANQPKLMRELLVEMLAEESWIEIVGEVAQEAEIRESVQKTAPDLLVVTADNRASGPQSATNCFASTPRYTSSRSHRTKITPSVIGRPSIFMPPISNRRNRVSLAP